MSEVDRPGADLKVRTQLSFTGLRERTGPMTWPQQAILSVVLCDKELAYRRNMSQIWTMEGEISEKTVLEAFSILVEQLETLRTTYVIDRVGESWPEQVVRGSGQVPVHIHRVSAERVDAFAQNLLEQLRVIPFDLAVDIPLRLGVVSVDGGVQRVIVVLSHVAVDGRSLYLLKQMFFRILSDGPESLGAYAGRLEQPLERAVFERSPVGARLQSRSLAFWQRTYRRAPHVMLSGEPEGGAKYERAVMRSRAGARAMSTLVQRTGANSTAVLIGSLALILGATQGIDEVDIRTLVVNRQRAVAKYSIAALNLNGPFHLELNHEMPLAGHYAAARQAALQAVFYCECEPTMLDRELSKIAFQRGVGAAKYLFFNDRSRRLQSADAAPPVEDGSEEPVYFPDAEGVYYSSIPDDSPDYTSKLLLEVERVRDSLDLRVFIDRTSFGFGARDLLRYMHGVVTRAALDSSRTVGSLLDEVRRTPPDELR